MAHLILETSICKSTTDYNIAIVQRGGIQSAIFQVCGMYIPLFYTEKKINFW
jgi:hypothetical protein